MNKTNLPDFRVHNHGTIFLLVPNTDRARAWAESHLALDESFQPFSDRYVIEHRYIRDIVQGAIADGLEVR